MSETRATTPANKAARPKPVPPMHSRWKKGQSGNPKGRPKKVLQAERIAENSIEEAMKVLQKLLKSDDERVRLAAAERICDRVMGKAKQSVDVSSEKKAPADYDDAELLAIATASSAGADQEEEGTRVSH